MKVSIVLTRKERSAVWRFMTGRALSINLSNSPAARLAFSRHIQAISATLFTGRQTFSQLIGNRPFLDALERAGLRLFAIGEEEAVLLAEKEADLEIGERVNLFCYGRQKTLHVSSVKYFDYAQNKVVEAQGEISLDPSPRGGLESSGLNLCGMVAGKSRAMQAVVAIAQSAAGVDSPVIITGETGTGKELAAKIVHANSKRRDAVFLPINCAAFPAGLIESELFGHEAGSFTGAFKARKGIFETASDGTVFLDEIGDLPLEMQVKLLRVLQDGSFRRVGGTAILRTGARIIVATNKNLAKEVQAGRFREDLYYRVQVIDLHLPPLRNRRPDIIDLAQHFLAIFNNKTGRQKAGFSPEARDALFAYAWPGNIRELQNCIERAAVLSKGEVILAEDLYFMKKGLLAAGAAGDGEGPPADQSAIAAEVLMGRITLPAALLGMRDEIVLEAYRRSGGNMSAAAQLLGIPRPTMDNYLKRARG